jgi:ankyrin repeat protein
MATNFFETSPQSGRLHQNILDLGLCLGSKLPATGICYGFTIRWIEASLSNTQQVFRKRTQLIIELSRKLYWLKCELQRLKTQPPFNALIWDIVAFFESCALYQTPHHYSDIFLMVLHQSQIEHISTFASSAEVFQMGGIMQTEVIYFAEFNFRQLQTFAHQFSAIVDSHQYQKPLAMVITCIEKSGFHCVGLTYTSSTKTWGFLDININPLSSHTTSIDELCRQLSMITCYCFSIKLILTANFYHPRLLDQLLNLQTCMTIPQSRRRCQAFFNLAVYEKDDRLVAALLMLDHLNIKLNSQQRINPLMIAVQNNYLSILKMILADKRTNLNRIQQDGFFALYVAAKQGNLTCLKLLLTHPEINPNFALDNGDTSLHIAVIAGHLEIVKQLLRHPGIDPNQPNKIGITPLHLAAFQGNLHLLKTLLQQVNIDPNAAMQDGTTSLILSIFQGHWEVFNALLLTDDIQIDKPFFSMKSQLFVFISQFNAETRLRMNQYLETQSDFKRIEISPLTLAKIMGNSNMQQALMTRAHRMSSW